MPEDSLIPKFNLLHKLFCFFKDKKLITGIIFFSFIIRLTFGLAVNFAEVNTKYLQDYTQIYLLGLKFYTTNYWPYFGPDITYTYAQIPGALQSLLVGLPFFIFEQPEAPFIFLNCISTLALVILAWYISKRIKDIPEWFIYAWIYLQHPGQ